MSRVILAKIYHVADEYSMGAGENGPVKSSPEPMPAMQSFKHKKFLTRCNSPCYVRIVVNYKEDDICQEELSRKRVNSIRSC